MKCRRKIAHRRCARYGKRRMARNRRVSRMGRAGTHVTRLEMETWMPPEIIAGTLKQKEQWYKAWRESGPGEGWSRGGRPRTPIGSHYWARRGYDSDRPFVAYWSEPRKLWRKAGARKNPRRKARSR